MTTTPKAAALGCAALLSIALAAGCGNDDDETAAGQANDQDQQAATTAGVSTAGTDEQQIKRVFAHVQSSFLKSGQAFCNDLAPPGQREVVRFSRTLSIKGDCPAAIDELAKRNKAAGLKQVEAKILAVDVRGDNAKVRVKDNDRPPIFMRFVKLDGQWKLYSPGFEAALEPKGGRAARGS